GILAELLTSTLGVHSGYFHNIHATLLTSEPSSANSPIPEILNLKGKRVVMGSEPDKAVSIKSSVMKLLTGNDRLCGRYLFSNKDVNFSPQHTIILQTNAIPKMDAQDQAVWRRCRIQDFPHSFVKDPKLPHERKINDKLKEEVKTWGPQFMLLLLDWYNIYISEGLHPTDAMLVKADETRADNDHFLRWAIERIVATPGVHIHHKTAREDYYEWCRSNGINCVLSKREFGQRMNGHFPLAEGHKRDLRINGVTDAGVRNHSLVQILY
ncbi:hypothetical protein HDU81_001172, partial [Chytriomyces hyalinus]